MLYITLRVSGVISLFWTFMHHQNMVMWMTASMRNWNVNSINSLKWQIQILFTDFNAKVGKKGIFKPTVGNEVVMNSEY
jgi:succinate dehydrogenase hydrophobic anchor subunit